MPLSTQRLVAGWLGLQTAWQAVCRPVYVMQSAAVVTLKRQPYTKMPPTRSRSIGSAKAPVADLLREQTATSFRTHDRGRRVRGRGLSMLRRIGHAPGLVDPAKAHTAKTDDHASRARSLDDPQRPALIPPAGPLIPPSSPHPIGPPSSIRLFFFDLRLSSRPVLVPPS